MHSSLFFLTQGGGGGAKLFSSPLQGEVPKAGGAPSAAHLVGESEGPPQSIRTPSARGQPLQVREDGSVARARQIGCEVS